jgi:hypothetical protein
LKIKGFVRNRYRKNIYSIPVPHAVPTPTEEAPVQAFRMFHFSNCSPLNANASKKQFPGGHIFYMGIDTQYPKP